MQPKNYVMVNEFIPVAFLKLMKVLHTQGRKKSKYRELEVSQAHIGALRALGASKTLFILV